MQLTASMSCPSRQYVLTPEIKMDWTVCVQALYDGMLLDYPFAHIFVRILQGYRPLFDELATLDSELHQNLTRLKQVAALVLILLALWPTA